MDLKVDGVLVVVFFPCLSIQKTTCSQVPTFVSYQLKVYLNPFLDKESQEEMKMDLVCLFNSTYCQ